MRNYENFSPTDFETFVADLLGAALGMRFETFPRGADGGVDLRHVPSAGGPPDVVQCKHYTGSSVSAVVRAARQEAQRLPNLDPQPGTYRFVTSKGLTAVNKRAIAGELEPWISTENHVLGAQDLEGLLNTHPDVERRQVKLWLTGGTQLAALLNAGTIHRSQSLLEEIERAMPTYVQSDVFTTARDRLRQEHVLMIAGVPGIGKTTLARMLLADAVLDGYEPIEVSGDIEEAWEVLDDSVKQIFLYDDFLGRTALSERFGKNEDRRLIEFMRRTARRRSSLFVLTTREYILRQAVQLYERLDQEGVDSSRFLLELPSYRRLDKARIFANHAFHSPRVTQEMRQELVRDDAYARIIDHRNYNPRTIEWITGLAGRWDDTIQAGGYVEYAVEVLQHPELIWRHAFEQELGDHGRALVLVLASLPRDVDVTDLESAFEALTKEMGLPLTSQAFRNTLSALDDSLIKISHTEVPGEAKVVVNLHDPSIIDFVVDYLRGSPEDLRILARACLYFEQAAWLLETAVSDSELNTTVTDVCTALQRTYMAVAITRITVSVGPMSWVYRELGKRDFEQRLRLILGPASSDTELGRWWREAFDERVARWSHGEGEPESVLKLLAAIAEDFDVDVEAAARAAKSVLTSGPSYVQSLEWLAELHAGFPDVFGFDEWEAQVNEFDTWLNNDFSHEAQDMFDSQELYFVEQVANSYGVVIEDAVWTDVEETVRRNEAERDSEIEPDPDYDTRASHHDIAAEEREIEGIFERLAE